MAVIYDACNKNDALSLGPKVSAFLEIAHTTLLSLTASQFSRIPQLEVNIEEEGNRLRSDFNTFLSSLLSNLSEKSDQEEMNIMNMK